MTSLPLFFTVFVCIAAARTAATTDPAEADAVRVLFKFLNTPGQLRAWNADGGDPCGESWLGVTCKGSHVTEIKLPGLGLSGTLGYTLQSLGSLKILDMSNNNLGGDISYQLPPNVEQLNLANNQFTGNVPYSVSTLTSLITLNLAHNKLQGTLFDMFQQLSSLSTLDLSFNQLSGNLPQSFRDLSSVESMYLQNNAFTGPIDMLADLPLKTLNVENNQLNGWIPDSLKRGVDLRSGGNSWNSGAAPPPPPGSPNRRPVSNKTPVGNQQANGEKKKSSVGVIAGVLISLLFVGGIIAFFVIKKRWKKRSTRDVESTDQLPIVQVSSVEPIAFKSLQPPNDFKPFQPSKTDKSAAPISLKPPPDRRQSYGEDDFAVAGKPPVVKKTVRAPTNVKVYSIADLQMATGSFSYSHLVGEGIFGRVYRAQLDGVLLAVKKIDTRSLPSGSHDEFIEIVSKLAELHHSNLSELVGYCSEHGQHLLAYEFHKNGSLHDFLHIPDEQGKRLIWNTRVRIALGVARALEYLHEICDPPIVHKNTCSDNILLDSEFNGHLSDCLASFLPSADQILSEEGESGYLAPEVTMKGEHTLKSDVYSFGVVMLELLTGRQPYNSSRPRNEQSLVRWATPQLHDIDALSKMVDPSLGGLYPVKALSRFADVIALCVQTEPEFRPPMSEVVESLLRLMQRSNMSKRTLSVEQSVPGREDGDSYD